jgi:microcystin-dependent protein
MLDSLIPIGSVLPYAGPLANTEDAPAQGDSLAVKVELIKANLANDGWMFCDGTALPIKGYWPLFGVIGRAYGGDATTFRLPDLRGRFIRGVTGDLGPGEPVRDTDIATRQASADGGNTQNRVGSLQSDAFQGHEHDYKAVDQAAVPPVLGPGDAPTYGIKEESTSSEEIQSPDGTPRVAKETRPVNLYLNYIIRCR